jgi:hypothetical protein
LIDPSVEATVASCKQSSLQKQSYGVALIGAGLGDTLTGYLEGNHSHTDVLSISKDHFKDVYNLGHGFGFGFHYLLPSFLPKCSLTCSSADFISLIKKYGLSRGLTGLEFRDSKIANFGLDAKQVLGCLFNRKGYNKEAARLEYLIDDLVEAGLQRNRLQEKL